MSIAILTAADTPSDGLPREVLSQLVQRAALAGKTVALRHCRRCGSEFVLLDPRHCDGSDGAGLPCIVVNPDPSRPAEASSRSGALSVIDGYGAQGYVLALTLALDYLGCNDWENDVHVGTRAMRYCYFADYEIQMGDRMRVWGQATLVHEVADDNHARPGARTAAHPREGSRRTRRATWVCARAPCTVSIERRSRCTGLVIAVTMRAAWLHDAVTPHAD